ncbi:MAG TPA: flagellar biosynthesis protein FlhB [Phycisphaerales bacterium]|nr:flagellar biosynthesis protein FlhB [Phycisphaerales bacterium]
MAEDLGEKTQAPSSRKREEARDRGQVARSTDFGAGTDLIVAFILLLVFGAPLTAGLAGLIRFLLDDRDSGKMLRSEGIGDLCWWTAQQAVLVAAPIIVVLFLITLVAHILQVGWHPTLDPLMPKLDRLSPMKGFQRLFGTRNVVKTILGVIKITMLCLVVVGVSMSEWERIVALSQLEVRAMWSVLLVIITKLLGWTLLVMLVIGIADFAYQRWQMTRDLMMTRQESREEHKSMEGDPEIRGRRLKIARQIALQRLHTNVPKANVIVTNPTHYAVALQYDAKTMAAPKVVAKGADFMAMRIREIAAAHKIPVVERPPLARALYAGVPVGKQIKPEYYEAVAEILAYVYRLQDAGEKAA